MPKNLRICEFFCIFALEMRKIAFILTLCAFVLCAHAETLLLHTGARVQGQIIFQNEEVIIIRNADGARFQYPRADVKEIISDDQEGQMPNDSINVQMVNDQMVNKKASILLELSCAPAIMIPFSPGGNAGIDLLAGTHHIKDRHIFVGAGVGYHGYFMYGYTYNFLPIEAKVSVPFFEAKHAPVFGFALGYGIALSKDYIGGIYTGLDFGYRYQINPNSSLAVLVFASFQQARLNVTETIEGYSYTSRPGRNFVTPGVKFALYF